MNEIIFAITQMTACGAERMAALLCNELSKRGRKVTLIKKKKKKSKSFLEILHPQIRNILLYQMRLCFGQGGRQKLKEFFYIMIMIRTIFISIIREITIRYYG